MSIDPSDPCAVVAALETALLTLVTGGQVAQVEFEAGNGSRRRVQYTAASVSELRQELTRYRGLCAAAQGSRPKRFGMWAGGSQP